MVDAVIFMLHPASLADRGVLFFTCPSVHPFIQARYFGNEWTDVDANWRKWSTGQGN